MVEPLGDVALKSGERVSVAAIRGPDEAWRPRLTRMLGHKGDPWRWQNSELLTRDTGLDAWFYVLHRDGTPFAHIMTAEYRGVGIFGHVWTEPADRRQGAAVKLMERQMTHFRARHGRALFLHTDFASPAFQLYERHGFAAVEAKSGTMAFAAAGLKDFEAAYFAPASVQIQPLGWPHWPAAAALFTSGVPGVVRCAPLGIFGRQSPEGYLLPWLQAASEGRPPQIHVATTPEGAVVGLAAWDRDALSRDAVAVDLFCHPGFWAHGPKLLQATLANAPATRRVAYADTDCPAKVAMLTAAGFRVVTMWPRRLAVDAVASRFVDLVMLEKT